MIEPRAHELLALQLQTEQVHLFLPRFESKSQFFLERQLASMGMRSLFQHPDADLSGIDGTRELYASSVVHRAFVNGDENGTEAAAATGVVMRSRAAFHRAPVELRVDRPFLFWIVDRPTGSVLFAGRVVDPGDV
jgi:serpin B